MNTRSEDSEKVPPIHLEEILNEDFLMPLKVTKYRMAKAISVDPRRIHSTVRGKRSVTGETELLF